jgi:hypothetical protein
MALDASADLADFPAGFSICNSGSYFSEVNNGKH